MLTRQNLETYLADLLHITDYHDYAPNGLQIEGTPEIKKIITGVTACQALLDAAVAEKADAVLVHHGYFWKGESPILQGPKAQRIRTLLAHDINLFAYHLPLDDHPTLGNNVQLADKLGIDISGKFATATQPDIGMLGQFETPISPQDLSEKLRTVLGQAPILLTQTEHLITTVAWCSGGAQDYIEQAAAAGADCYITGEASERTFHAACELGIHFYAAGHHATERYGVQALGRHLQATFDIEHQFIDITNPI